MEYQILYILLSVAVVAGAIVILTASNKRKDKQDTKKENKSNQIK